MAVTATDIVEGSIVRAVDGAVGYVERTITSPRTGRFSHLVVERLGAPDTFWIVPADSLRGVDPRLGVGLNQSRAEVNALPAHRRLNGEWLRPDAALRPIEFPPLRPDTDLSGDVARALQSDPIVAAALPAVAVDAGVVTLTGIVPTGLARLAAQKLTEDVSGVVRVRNNLQSDEELAVAINRDLQADEAIRRNRVRARVFKGQLLWQPEAVDPQVRQAAEDIARRHLPTNKPGELP